MAFKDFAEREQGVKLLQRSLERGRLAHGYLFTGHDLEKLEVLARTLAKTLNCLEPVRGAQGTPIDCCDHCANCLRIDGANHPDTHWVRPESKSRLITVDQVRELMQGINLKPAEGGYKVAVIVAADRLNAQAANAFLKTLEEPPPKSVLILLTTESQRILETILSRCLRVSFGGEGARHLKAAEKEWLGKFSEMASAEQKSLLNRYRLLDVLLQQLNRLKSATEENLTAQSPLQRHADAEQELRERWEEELTAAIEAEYRRQRSDLLLVLQRWFRDVWLHSLAKSEVHNRKPEAKAADAERHIDDDLLDFPELNGAKAVAERISPREALENLEMLEGTQRLLYTNVQEALALEVGLLKLHL